MRQNRRAIENLLFSLFRRLTTIETRERELLKYNNAFNSFRAMIINLSLKGDNTERIIIKKEQQELDEYKQGSIINKKKDRAL